VNIFVEAKNLWQEVAPNAKWDFIKWGGAGMLTASYVIIQKLRHLPFDWIVAFSIFVLSLIVFAVGIRKRNYGQQQTLKSGASDLLAVEPQAVVDLDQIVRRSFNSVLEADAERNLSHALQLKPQADRESFLIKFIAQGIISYTYDSLWWVIYGSQLRALLELNQRGFMRQEEIKPYYDKAAEHFSAVYATYTFDQWLEFMRIQQVLIDHPGEVVEITVKGRDFLKFIIHWGYSIERRPN